MIEDTWPKDDLRSAFVAGAAWWQYYSTDFSMWQSDRQLAEQEAEKRYGSVAERLKREIVGE